MPSGLPRRLALAALALPSAALPGPSPSPAPGLPPGLVWVTSRAPDQPSTLHAVAADGTATATALRYAVNAMGCTAGGTLVALATARDGRRLPGGPHLVRLTTAGAVTDLGPAPGGRRLAGASGGTVATAPSGRADLLVATGAELHTIRIPSAGLTRPTVGPTRRLPPLPFAGDWAVDPRTGELVTVVAVDGAARLVRAQPTADAEPGRGRAPGLRTATVAGLPAAAFGGVAVLADGSVAVVRNRADGPGAGPATGHAPSGGALYRIPVPPSEPDRPAPAEHLADLGAVASSDATACPVAPPRAPGARGATRSG